MIHHLDVGELQVPKLSTIFDKANFKKILILYRIFILILNRFSQGRFHISLEEFSNFFILVKYEYKQMMNSICKICDNRSFGHI